MINIILLVNLLVKLADGKGSDVLNEVPLIDGHNDLAINIYTLENNQLKNFNLDSNLKENAKWNIPKSYTDLPRLRKGKVGGQVWAAYVDCSRNYKDAVERTLEQIDIIKRFVKKYPKDFKLVTNADQIMEAFKEKKIASMIDVEGGHSIDSRLAVLRSYYDLGVRCMTITHTCNVPWADASPIDAEEGAEKRNLTDWGKNVIREMNRLGMIVDIAHTSEGVMMDALETSKAPVIFSHADTYGVFPHHRNVKDHVLKKLKENNGVIMINFYSGYVGGNNTIYDVINHINHARDLIGAEHIGLGSDFDGVLETPKGLEDTTKYPDLFDLLAEHGHGWKPWSADELKKLAGMNFIRVFKAVEAVRDSLKDTEIIDDPIPYDEVFSANAEAKVCRTDLEKYITEGASEIMADEAAEGSGESFEMTIFL